MKDTHHDHTFVPAQQLLQLVHDLRTPLSVICMGLESLQFVRGDEDQYTEILEMVSAEGAEPLKVLIDRLDQLAGKQDL